MASTDITGWFDAHDCQLDDLIALTRHPVTVEMYRHAATIESGVVVYDSTALSVAAADPEGRRAVMAELAEVLMNGPGVAVFRQAFAPEVVTVVTDVFNDIISHERASGIGGGDHFARPGDNDRVWNALEKLALRNPRAFVSYYDNDVMALAAHAWLGPNYQVTSQVNVVNPGGVQQSPHRDYHLGFMTDDLAAQFPAHVHRFSPMLTLQGAVAHCDMPVESGPTMYLPHSQKYAPGYVAWRRPEFKRYFEQAHVQLPLQVGDAVFFNPALFHGAGTNRTTGIHRIANLLQISSALGRAMEAVDRRAIIVALFPVLLEEIEAGLDSRAVGRILAASAEGYAFPGDLDRDTPEGESSDHSDVDITVRALAEHWSVGAFADRLARG